MAGRDFIRAADLAEETHFTYSAVTRKVSNTTRSKHNASDPPYRALFTLHSGDLILTGTPWLADVAWIRLALLCAIRYLATASEVT